MSIPDHLMENKELCTLEKRGYTYILTITGEGEHRLNPDFIDSILSALRRLKAEPTFPCSALITTAQGKFFCNGFDLAWVQSSVPRFKFLFSKLQSLVLEFLSLPMPTIAAITGHSLASGMALVLSHDYVLMRKDRGYLYFNEMYIGFLIPKWFINFIKCKITDSKIRQEAIMSAAKYTAEMAVARGIVHSAYDGAEETVDAAVRLGEELVKRRWDGYVYANTRIEIFRDVMDSNLDEEGLEENIRRFITQSKMKKCLYIFFFGVNKLEEMLAVSIDMVFSLIQPFVVIVSLLISTILIGDRHSNMFKDRSKKISKQKYLSYTKKLHSKKMKERKKKKGKVIPKSHSYSISPVEIHLSDSSCLPSSTPLHTWTTSLIL